MQEPRRRELLGMGGKRDGRPSTQKRSWVRAAGGKQQATGPWAVQNPMVLKTRARGSGHVLTSSKGIRLCW